MIINTYFYIRCRYWRLDRTPLEGLVAYQIGPNPASDDGLLLTSIPRRTSLDARTAVCGNSERRVWGDLWGSPCLGLTSTERPLLEDVSYATGTANHDIHGIYLLRYGHECIHCPQ